MDDCSSINSDELIDKAERLDAMGLVAEAIECWRTVARHEPDPVALCRLGNLLMESGEWSEAEQMFLSAIALAPTFPNAYNLLGLLHLECGNPHEALDYFGKSLRIDQNARTLTLLGSTQAQLGMLTAARESFKGALNIDPCYEEACYNLGLTLRHEWPDQAISSFRRAVELDPEYAMAHRELGWALRGLDQYREAEHHIRRAIELDDSDAWAYIYLGNLLWGKRDLASAEQAFLRATEVWPNDSIPHWSLAIFYEYIDRPREADFFYEKALQLNPDDPLANLRFGLYLKETGEIAKAKTYLQRALALEPEDERAASALAELD